MKKYGMRNILYLSFILLLFSLFISCSKIKLLQKDKSIFFLDKEAEKQTKDSIEHSFFLIGNIGRTKIDIFLLKFLEKKLFLSQERSSVIFLGNNIGAKGFPEKFQKRRKKVEKKLDFKLNILKNYEGNIIFIPGNLEWVRGRKRGKNSLKRQEKYIEEFFNNKNVFFPDNACPGPVEIPINNDIVVIVIDTQWWLLNSLSFDNDNNCGYEKEADFFIEIAYALRRNKDKKIIFAAYHPLFSAGRHGGNFPTPQYFSPSVFYAVFRKFRGSKQDISHPEYQKLKEILLGIFKDFPNLIYVSSHENNLQYLYRNKLHHIISGSACKTSYVRKSNKIDFIAKKKGFSQIIMCKNGNVWLLFWQVDKKVRNGKMLYKKLLFNKIKVFKNTENRNLNYQDSTVFVAPSTQYRARNFTRLWAGNNYRDEWEMSQKFKVFDISKIKGRLKIIKKSGTWASSIYWLIDTCGNKYTLRSVELYADKKLPRQIKKTFAVDLIQDQISASHPYGALIIPKLAKAVGVLQNQAEIFYIPNDPNLGQYREDISNRLFWFEESIESLCKKKNKEVEIIRSDELEKKIRKNAKYRINTKEVLRARLFDMFINDWNRGDEQWKWLGEKKENKIFYRPISKHREQSFFLVEGILPWLASQFFILRKLRGFDYDTKSIEGLIYNARHFDRAYLNQANLNDWLEMADSLKYILSNDVIEDAVKKLPKDIFNISGNEIIKKLKARRDNISVFAKKAYSFLAKEVDVIGTKEKDLFEVERLDDERTSVRVVALKKAEDKELIRSDTLFYRVFNTNETREIRLYGLKKDDRFILSGGVRKGIKIRIIGGKGDDKVIDESFVRGGSKKTLVYDISGKIKIDKGRETKDLTSFNYKLNKYKKNYFEYNLLRPDVGFNYTTFDGVFLGLGFVKITHGFKKEPFASYQKFSLQIATITDAFKIKYEGQFSQLINNWDFHLNFNYNAPESRNFFGMGNKTRKHKHSHKYNRIAYNQLIVNPILSGELNKDTRIYGGFFYDRAEIENIPKHILDANQIQKNKNNLFETKEYLGFSTRLFVDSRNHKILPTRGLYINNSAQVFYGINNEFDFFRLETDIRLFFSFTNPSYTVLALRLGGVYTSKTDFYHAATLGYVQNLRAYDQTRFTGKSCLYQNTEIRYQLFPFKNYIFTGQLGVLAFFDLGRVWIENETFEKWHYSYGGGFWLAPFKIAVVSLTWGRSAEKQENIKLSLKHFF